MQVVALIILFAWVAFWIYWLAVSVGVKAGRTRWGSFATAGPYRGVRHPIYPGLILAMVGTAVAVSWYWLIAVALLAAYFIYSATREERYMTGAFPDAYPAYKRHTKMLIPFVL